MVFVVTGTSTGIGFDLVQALKQKNGVILAGVRSEADRAKLAALGTQVRPVLLDVCSDDQIAELKKLVETTTGPLFLVNNAGVASGCALENDSMDLIRHVFEVNYFGAIKMIKALLPMMRERGGRIVNVGSLAGVIAMPYMGAYAASKFAIEGASDSLRRELSPFGISVSLIEPGIIATPIWKKGLEVLDRKYMGQVSPYSPYLKTFYGLVEWSDKNAAPVSHVTKQIMKALESKKPKARYAAGPGVALQIWLYKLLPSSLFDRVVRKIYRH